MAENQEDFFTLCDKNEKFDVWYEYIEEDDSLFPKWSAYYDITKISRGETVFYGFDDYSQAVREATAYIWIIIAVSTLVMVFMIVMFVLVARNPEKFSPKTVKFFIKPSSLVGYEKTRKQSKKRKYKK